MTNTLHLPRRHRRPLLFPPGLLALAWLLWLGCAALPQMRGMEREWVLQMTFPPLVQGRNPMIPLPMKNAFFWKEPYMSPLETEAFRPWYNISFTGNCWADYFSYKQVHVLLNEFQNAPNHNRGLRIKLLSQASYATFIRVLDLMNIYDQKMYWLDFQHKPYSLYVFTKERHFNYPEAFLENDVINIQPPVPIITQTHIQLVLSRLEAALSSLPYALLLHPDWRNTTLLLLLLALLSVIRLYRQYRAS